MKNLFNGKKKRISLIIVILLLVGLVVVIKYTSLNKDTTTSLTAINDNKESTSPTNENKENNEVIPQTEDNDNIENTNITKEDSSNDKSSNNTKNDNNNSTENYKPSGGSSNISKPENKPSKPNNVGGSNGGSTHSHNWVAQTKQVYHKEQGHYENVLVKPAWTEQVPVYEERERSICNGCGKDITADPWKHIKEQMLAGNSKCGGYHSEWKNVQVGTKTVKHDAVYKKKWVVNKKAWTETVVTGHKCSGCGQTK